jgi:hypothetical protein
MLNFPDAPTVGQSFPPYTWDGVKWVWATPIDPHSYGDPPSDTNPLMNGVLMPGLSYSYSRADHVHPTDTSRAPLPNPSLTGTTTAPAASVTSVSVAGTFMAVGDGNLLGNPSGASQPAAVAKSDANIILYDGGPDNWAGIGTDQNGRWWIRTGLSGQPSAAFFIDQARDATFLKTPIAPTPPSSDSSSKFATTAFVAANPASGPYIPLNANSNVTGRLDVGNGDWRVYRSDGTGVVFLNNTGDRYLYFNGSGYHMPGAHANSANGRLWGAGDFPTPIINIRLAYLGDPVFANNSGLQEPYGGGCTTGHDGLYTGLQWRFRQFQIQLGNGGWYAVGYV